MTTPCRTARPARALLALAALVLGAGCGDAETAVLVTISPEPGLAADTIVVEAVGRDAAGAAHPLEQRSYRVATWPQSIAVIAGRQYGAGVDVSVVGFEAGVETGRGGARLDFEAGETVKGQVVLRAACRGVSCEGRSFCGAGGQCEPQAQRLEFTVNATGAGDQLSPAVAAVGDASFVVVWVEDLPTSPNPPALRFRLLGRGGIPLSDTDLTVSSDGVEQRDPVVASEPSGPEIAIAWSEGAAGVRLRRFDHEGQALTGTDAASPTGSYEQHAPAIGGNQQGFLLAWEDIRAPSGSGYRVRYRRGIWGGAWWDMGDEYVATDPSSEERSPAVAAGCGGDGAFLVAWQDASNAAPDLFGTQIRGRWITVDPAQSQEEVINLSVAGSQITPAGAAGTAMGAIVWDDRGEPSDPQYPPAVRARYCTMTAPGQRTQETLVADGGLAGAAPAVAIAGGVALVVWEGTEAGQPGTVIRGLRLDANGLPRDAAPFVVAGERLGDQTRPRVAASLEDFLVVWQESGGDGPAGGSAVRARFVPVSGAP